MTQAWTFKERAALHKHFQIANIVDLVGEICQASGNNRTHSAVSGQLFRMGLKRDRRSAFTESEKNYIAENIDRPYKAIAEYLTKNYNFTRTERSIARYVYRQKNLGLKFARESWSREEYLFIRRAANRLTTNEIINELKERFPTVRSKTAVRSYLHRLKLKSKPTKRGPKPKQEENTKVTIFLPTMKPVIKSINLISAMSMADISARILAKSIGVSEDGMIHMMRWGVPKEYAKQIRQTLNI